MNLFEAKVVSCDRRGTHALLGIGRSRLAVRAWPEMQEGLSVRIRIRPEDVVLCADPPGRVSARNVLPGHVKAIKASPDGAYVTAEVGFPLAALVTRAAVTELGLKRGAPVFSLIKATAVVPEVEVLPRFGLYVLGRHGPIEARHLDFLRAIDSRGSMLAAARTFGVAYRTGWLWVEEVNRAWGRSLVGRTHGGRGGGGAKLTPEGSALLRQVAAAERAANARIRKR